jgi:hypothetical protein
MGNIFCPAAYFYIDQRNQTGQLSSTVKTVL